MIGSLATKAPSFDSVNELAAIPELPKYGLTREEVVLSLSNRIFEMTNDIDLKKCQASDLVPYIKVIYFAWDILYETLSLEEQHRWVMHFIYELSSIVNSSALSFSDRGFVIILIGRMEVCACSLHILATY